MQDEDQPSTKTTEKDITELSDLLKGVRIQFNKCFDKLDQIYGNNANKEAKEENKNQIKENKANLSTLTLTQLGGNNNSKNDTEESDKKDDSKHDDKSDSQQSPKKKQTKDIDECVHSKDEIQPESNLVDIDRVNINETVNIEKNCDKDGEHTPKQKIPVRHGYQPSPEHENPDWQLKYPMLVELIPSSGIYINKKDFERCENVSGDVPCFIEHLVTAIFKPAKHNVNHSKWNLRYADVTELVPKSNIFVSKNKFDNLKKITDNWEKLAEDAMEVIFTDEALAVCSRTGRKSNRYSYNEALESPRLNERGYQALVTFVNDCRKKQGLDDLNEIDKIIGNKLKKCKSKNKK